MNSVFREPMNRKDKRLLAKQMQKQETDFRMSSLGKKIEIANAKRQETIERLSQQGISPADLEAEYNKGFNEGYKIAATNAIKMSYAAICLALKKLYHFGEKRCCDVLKEVDYAMLYELSSEELIDKVYDELGLTINFKETFDRVQGKE